MSFRGRWNIDGIKIINAKPLHVAGNKYVIQDAIRVKEYATFHTCAAAFRKNNEEELSGTLILPRIYEMLCAELNE